MYTQRCRSSPLPPHLPAPPNLVRNSIPIETTSRATLLAKADGVLAGQALANQILAAVDPDLVVAWSKVDGDSIAKGEVFMEVEGSAHSILRAERVLLNFMQAWPTWPLCGGHLVCHFAPSSQSFGRLLWENIPHVSVSFLTVIIACGGVPGWRA